MLPVTRESDARTLPEAAYRFVRHEPGIDVTLSGTGVGYAAARGRPNPPALDRASEPAHHRVVMRRLKVTCIPRQEGQMILEHDVLLVGSRGRRRCRALFDSGASYSLIRPDIAEELETPVLLPDPENWIFETAEAGHLMAATHRVGIDFRFDDSKARFSDEFIILPGCSEEVIVGATTMQKWQITLDFAAEQVNYRKTAQRLRV